MRKLRAALAAATVAALLTAGGCDSQCSDEGARRYSADDVQVCRDGRWIDDPGQVT